MELFFSRINQDTCVSISDIGPLVDNSYSIVRKSGNHDDNWIVADTHLCVSFENRDWLSAHASKHIDNDSKWYIFMQTSRTDMPHGCGWKDLATIEPTDFKGNKTCLLYTSPSPRD